MSYNYVGKMSGSDVPYYACRNVVGRLGRDILGHVG